MGIFDKVTDKVQKGLTNVQGKSKHFAVSDEEIQKILVDDENYIGKVTQAKPINASTIILTSDRVIVYDKGLVKDSFKDHYFRDMKQIVLSDNITGSVITFAFELNGSKGQIEVGALPKEEAKAFYSEVQNIEKIWWEERRQLELDDKRAESGATNIQVGATPSEPETKDENDIEAKLGKIKGLFDKGLITEDEYNSKKEKILEEL
jgi:hypothetical protein|tara:strand:- start:232 stop:849 length:618 start_codon:yes stop_codon:yes gene_type:complete